MVIHPESVTDIFSDKTKHDKRLVHEFLNWTGNNFLLVLATKFVFPQSAIMDEDGLKVVVGDWVVMSNGKGWLQHGEDGRDKYWNGHIEHKARVMPLLRRYDYSGFVTFFCHGNASGNASGNVTRYRCCTSMKILPKFTRRIPQGKVQRVYREPVCSSQSVKESMLTVRSKQSTINFRD